MAIGFGIIVVVGGVECKVAKRECLFCFFFLFLFLYMFFFFWVLKIKIVRKISHVLRRRMFQGFHFVLDGEDRDQREFINN